MSSAALPIPLSPLAMPASRLLQRVRLLAGPAGTRLFFAEPAPSAPAGRPGPLPPVQIQSLYLAGAPGVATDFSVPRLLSGSPQWDVALDSTGQPRLVSTHFGGALNSLSVRSGAHQQPLAPLKDSDDLGDPRFSRGPGLAGAITALANGQQLLLFRPALGGRYADARVILSGDDLDGALLLGSPGRLQLLTRTRQDGPQRGRFPGRLEVRTLGPDLTPTGAAAPVFGDERIFDFDADVTPTGIVVLATTREGFALARLSHGQSPIVEIHSHPGLLGTLSLAADGPALRLAFLPPDGGVLLGTAAV